MHWGISIQYSRDIKKLLAILGDKNSTTSSYPFLLKHGGEKVIMQTTHNIDKMPGQFSNDSENNNNNKKNIVLEIESL